MPGCVAAQPFLVSCRRPLMTAFTALHRSCRWCTTKSEHSRVARRACPRHLRVIFAPSLPGFTADSEHIAFPPAPAPCG
jgi:hypothetical protein